MLQQAFRDECMSRTQCFESYSRFKTGRMSIDEDPRSGRPSTSTGEAHIDATRDLITQNRRLTIIEIAEDVCISFGLCQTILTEKHNMQHVAAKFMTRVLTEDQKANSDNKSQELFDRVSIDENFLKTIVTWDETWVYGYDVEIKAQSSQWVGQASPRPKKAQMSRSNMKVMVVFFDWHGVIHYEFLPRGQTVNKFYVAVLKRLKETVRRKRPQLWTNQIGCCTTTMHQLTRRSLCAIFWLKMKGLLYPSHPTLQIWLQRTFFCFISWSLPWKDAVSTHLTRSRKIWWRSC